MAAVEIPTAPLPARAGGPGLASPEPPIPGLDQPLPPELVGRSHGWWFGYRQWPVFSRRWVVGRLRPFGLLIGVVMLFAIGPLLSAEVGEVPFGGTVHILFNLALPVLLGPLLAARVRRRGWAARREFAALVVVMLAIVCGLHVFNRFAAEPMKQWVAEQAGQVDAQGKRRKVLMSFGLTFVAPTEPQPGVEGGPALQAIGAGKAGVQGGEPWWRWGLDHGMVALLTLWLAGGMGLLAWRRERDGLAALATERALAREQAQRREAELRLSVLAAQIEPHFLFNTLAGVRSAIATDPTRASDMIDRLADYLRAAIPRLRRDGSAQATVGAQFEMARAYLGLMAARMPRLSFAIELPAVLADAHCPPLLLISLVENAVRHGVEPKLGPAHIGVRAEVGGDGRLHLVVADDGIGFGSSAGGGGVGLSNVRERLLQLYGARAELALKARPAGGVEAVISLPLEKQP